MHFRLWQILLQKSVEIGRETTIANPTTATAFLRALGPSYRTTYHWKVAERMLEVAWTSAEAEDMAAQAFKIALEADDLLID
jgi:hypothetical protein